MRCPHCNGLVDLFAELEQESRLLPDTDGYAEFERCPNCNEWIEDGEWLFSIITSENEQRWYSRKEGLQG